MIPVWFFHANTLYVPFGIQPWLRTQPSSVPSPEPARQLADNTVRGRSGSMRSTMKVSREFVGSW